MFGLKHKVDGFGLQYCTINLEGLACCCSCTRHCEVEMATFFSEMGIGLRRWKFNIMDKKMKERMTRGNLQTF